MNLFPAPDHTRVSKWHPHAFTLSLAEVHSIHLTQEGPISPLQVVPTPLPTVITKYKSNKHETYTRISILITRPDGLLQKNGTSSHQSPLYGINSSVKLDCYGPTQST